MSDVVRRFGKVVLFGGLIALLPGCLLAAGAAIGAGVVAATSEDTARVDVVADPDDVYDFTIDLMETRGDVTSLEATSRRIEGEIGGSSVKVHIFVVKDYTRVDVQARQIAGAFPDLDLAKDVAGQIGRKFARLD